MSYYYNDFRSYKVTRADEITTGNQYVTIRPWQSSSQKERKKVDISPEQEELFKFVYASPTTDHIRRLTPVEFEQFISYHFARDGLYHPKLVGGPGDGGVDIELYARDENLPRLCGLVQCKRFLADNVTAEQIAPLIVAADAARVDRRCVFATSGFTPCTFLDDGATLGICYSQFAAG